MTLGRWIRRLVWLGLAGLLAWGLLWLFPWTHPAGETTFRLLSWNVHGFHNQFDGDSRQLILEGIAGQDADVLVLQEFPVSRGGGRVREALRRAGYPHEALFAYDHSVTDAYAMGLAIYSRHRILRFREFPLLPLAEGRILALAELELEGRVLRVGGVHMPNSDIHLNGKRAMIMSELFGENLRTLQCESLIAALQPWRQEALVVAGDYNTFPLSSAWRIMRGEYLDAFSAKEWTTGTFNIRENLDVKIDHIFHSKKVRSLTAQVVNLAGSDHRPVLAELQF
ncbi:MAG: endonuclease/exonuclease/phosphatase family protein [Candidatus Delongbacteria bacterium]